MKKQTTLMRILFLFTVFLFTMTSVGLAQSDYTVGTASNAELGSFLVDGQWKTLYYFTKDTPGVSNCKGQCAVIWPPFYTANIVVSARLNASDFSTITREDGMKQTTYRGMPLYYFNKDMAAGDTKGHQINNVWFVVPVQ